MDTKLDDLVSGTARGDARLLSRALTWIESRTAGSDDLLASLFDLRKPSWRIGVTGAPGAGKSTLASAIVRRLRGENKRVAVLAVDPTSPFTGGALLADRVRMLEHSGDDGVYVRSMASRGALGGLAPAAADALTVLSAAPFDVILIETVGVGQAEVDVAGLADHVALVLTPGAGDDIQTMKAGVMEIADVYVINKADQPGADVLERHIQALLSLRHDAAPRPPIVKTNALDGSGVADLLERLRERPLNACGPQIYWRNWIERALIRGLAESWIPRLAPDGALDRTAREVAAGRINPYRWAQNVLQTAGKT